MMIKYWQYTFDFISNQFAGLGSFLEPMNLIFTFVYLLAGVFLIALLFRLYKNYKQTESVEILLFFLGLLLLLISNIIFIFRRLTYASLGLWGLGDLLTIILQFPSELGVLLINSFAIRATFPKRSKIVFSSVLTIIVIKWIVESWAIMIGPPLYDVINFDIVYSLEYSLIRLIFLLPIYIIPPGVFFYSSKVIREESKPKSTRAMWLGIGMLCFAVPFLTVPIAVIIIGYVFRIVEILVVFAPIIFYICFTMPDWFKRRIGWTS